MLILKGLAAFFNDSRHFWWWICEFNIRKKKWQDQNDRPKIKFKYELRRNSVLDIIDYNLVHDSEIQNNRSNRSDGIYRKLVVTDRELIDM